MLEVQGNAEVNDFFRVRATQKVTRQPARKGILIDTGVGDIRYIPLSLIIGIIYIKVKIRSLGDNYVIRLCCRIEFLTVIYIFAVCRKVCSGVSDKHTDGITLLKGASLGVAALSRYGKGNMRFRNICLFLAAGSAEKGQ